MFRQQYVLIDGTGNTTWRQYIYTVRLLRRNLNAVMTAIAALNENLIWAGPRLQQSKARKHDNTRTM